MSNLADRIRKKMVTAISEYNMLQDQDRVMVAVSGGKDSTIMLLLLEEIRRKAEIHFTIEAVMLDQKQPGFDAYNYKNWLQNEKGLKLNILEQDTYSIVIEKTKQGKSFCRLCSRLRRGALYNFAHSNGYNKIALGHHRDDVNETVLMSMFFTGKISGMPPKLRSDDGRNVIIRPMCFVPESSLNGLMAELRIPVVPCNLCGSQKNQQRRRIKALLAGLEEQNPGIGSSITTSLGNIRPSQLMDKKLWDFDA